MGAFSASSYLVCKLEYSEYLQIFGIFTTVCLLWNYLIFFSPKKFDSFHKYAEEFQKKSWYPPFFDYKKCLTQTRDINEVDKKPSQSFIDLLVDLYYTNWRWFSERWCFIHLKYHGGRFVDLIKVYLHFLEIYNFLGQIKSNVVSPTNGTETFGFRWISTKSWNFPLLDSSEARAAQLWASPLGLGEKSKIKIKTCTLGFP